MARLSGDPPEVVALCLSCARDDCDGGEDCPERLALMGLERGPSPEGRGPRYCYLVEVDGERRSLSEWARALGVSGGALRMRIARRGGDAAAVIAAMIHSRESGGR